MKTCRKWSVDNSKADIGRYCREYHQAMLQIQKVKTLDVPQPNCHFLLAEIYAKKGPY